MTDLHLIYLGLLEMKWLLLPVIILLVLWSVYEQIERKWERRKVQISLPGGCEIVTKGDEIIE